MKEGDFRSLNRYGSTQGDVGGDRGEERYRGVSKVSRLGAAMVELLWKYSRQKWRILLIFRMAF